MQIGNIPFRPGKSDQPRRENEQEREDKGGTARMSIGTSGIPPSHTLSCMSNAALDEVPHTAN